MVVSHLALDLGLGDQRGHRVDDQDVDGVGLHEKIGDLEGLLTVIRLRHEEVIGLHAELLRVRDVEGVLRVDERCDPSILLRVRHRVKREGRLTG